MHPERDLNFVAFFLEKGLFCPSEDARRLAFGCKLQILASPRVFGMESHYICSFLYRLVLCIKKFTKNALTLTTQKSPLGVSFSLSHTHIGLSQASRSRENMRAMSNMSQNCAILYASDGFEIRKHFSGIAIISVATRIIFCYQFFSNFFHFRETRLLETNFPVDMDRKEFAGKLFGLNFFLLN